MPLLKKGSTGREVERLQSDLHRLGYDPGSIDGDFGPRTRQAVIAFQKGAGIEPDGVVGPITERALKKSVEAFISSKQKKESQKTEPAVANGEGPPIDRSLRLNDREYFSARHPKDLIVLHHTAGGSARSTVNWWNTDPQRIATAYIIERDGVIHEVFDPRSWAYHLGLKGTNGAVDRRSIGIEMASEGGLREEGGKLYTFDRISSGNEFRGEPYRHTSSWRGYRSFASYTPKQIDSAIALTRHLLDEFDIERRTPSNHFDYNASHRTFRGVVGHHHVRADKSDLHPGFPWSRLMEECELK